jgi:hypothetical protein
MEGGGHHLFEGTISALTEILYGMLHIQTGHKSEVLLPHQSAGCQRTEKINFLRKGSRLKIIVRQYIYEKCPTETRGQFQNQVTL